MRPQSIIRFEQAYLASIVVWGVNHALGWSKQIAAVEASFAQMPEMIPAGRAMLIGFTLFALFVSLLLWFFTARKASEVTKWIIVALFALSAVALPFSLAGFARTGALPAALNVVTFALTAFAVWMLFRPDATAWFRASDGSAPPPPVA
ncbi:MULTISPECIES: hypothetical protein [unclassified Sphingomonas]|uniref:hypothetical protein n=1 Tax=unclassified Sphingomonas TaxID=196159 RepID=UPI000835EED2|nr:MULTISPECIES: hypothetical protein [unclassified Sphingomonas]